MMIWMIVGMLVGVIVLMVVWFFRLGCGWVSMWYRFYEFVCGYWFMSIWVSLCLSGISC